MPTNNNVFDWQTTVAAPTAATQTGTWVWKIADPSWDSGFSNVGGALTGLVTFTGMAGDATVLGNTGPRGNIGWEAATQLQQQTGRDVYMITVHQGGAGIDQWGASGGNRTELNLQVTDALAAIPDGSGGTGLSKADLVIWMQGETDSGPVGAFPDLGKTAEDYSTKWLEFKTNAEANYADAESTRWLICDIPKYWPDTYGYWAGLVETVQNTNQFVNFIPSNGVGGESGAHYSGVGYLELGARVSKAVLAGVTPKPIQNRNSNFIEWQGTAETVQLAPHSGPAIAPVSVTVQGRDADTDAAAASAFLTGGGLTVKAGNGYLEGNGGVLTLAGGDGGATGAKGEVKLVNTSGRVASVTASAGYEGAMVGTCVTVGSGSNTITLTIPQNVSYMGLLTLETRIGNNTTGFAGAYIQYYTLSLANLLADFDWTVGLTSAPWGSQAIPDAPSGPVGEYALPVLSNPQNQVGSGLTFTIANGANKTTTDKHTVIRKLK